MPEFFIIDPKTLIIEARPYSHYRSGRFVWFTPEGKRRSTKYDGWTVATRAEAMARVAEIRALRQAMALNATWQRSSQLHAQAAELVDELRAAWLAAQQDEAWK